MARRTLVSRNVRVDLDVWDAAKDLAELDDELISEVVRRLLAQYVQRKQRK